MKFYVATGIEWAAYAVAAADLLAQEGHTLTYNWMKHGSVQSESDERIREVAAAEADGVRQADFLVALLPGGRGTHCEIGMAIGQGKRVFLVGRIRDGEKTCAFYFHPCCKHVEVVADIPRTLSGLV